MPQIKSAKKRMRQNEERRKRNRSRRSRMRSAIRKVESAVAAGDPEAAAEELRTAQAVIDRCAQKGIIHPNTAARRKSRLSREVQALSS